MENRKDPDSLLSPLFPFCSVCFGFRAASGFSYDGVSRYEEEEMGIGAIPSWRGRHDRVSPAPALSTRARRRGSRVPAADFRKCTGPACVAVPLLAGNTPRAPAGGCVSWKAHPQPWVKDIARPCFAAASCKKGPRARASGHCLQRAVGEIENETELPGPWSLLAGFVSAFPRRGCRRAAAEAANLPRAPVFCWCAARFPGSGVGGDF